MDNHQGRDPDDDPDDCRLESGKSLPVRVLASRRTRRPLNVDARDENTGSPRASVSRLKIVNRVGRPAAVNPWRGMYSQRPAASA